MGMQQQWYSHGKLLISGEYLVMEGAKAFALPLKQGQNLLLRNNEDTNRLSWNAFQNDEIWFKAVFEMGNFVVAETDNPQLADKLTLILQAIRRLSPAFLNDGTGLAVETNLGFNPEFGFGSSSTLISNLAWWADVNPFELLRLTFGGSGYDIACARTNSAIFFQLTDEGPTTQKVNFTPGFKDQIYFVYLGKKQKSTESIVDFKNSAVYNKDDVKAISRISEQIVASDSLQIFEDLLNEHEERMAVILRKPTVKSQMFSDIQGSVKSLGGWGGDFVLVTSHQPDSVFRDEMQRRGFPVVFGFDELVL
jgi:mevalonate kinase